jgi:molybdenum cofactor cytidylyltransferase
MIAGIVLGAGRSRRLGRNKLAVEIAGEPLLRRITRTALEAGLDPVVVVIRDDDTEAAAALDGLPCTRRSPSRDAAHQRESLIAGIEGLPAACDGAVVLLGDMPLVTADMVRAVAAERADLVASLYGTTTAPPTLITRALFAAVTQLAAGPVVPQLASLDGVRTATVPWPVDRMLDVDTDADIAAAEAQLGGFA